MVILQSPDLFIHVAIIYLRLAYFPSSSLSFFLYVFAFYKYSVNAE
jgi:hypothetical protein